MITIFWKIRKSFRFFLSLYVNYQQLVSFFAIHTPKIQKSRPDPDRIMANMNLFLPLICFGFSDIDK